MKYHDVSTGVMLTQIATHLGSPSAMTQNPHSAIIHLGHANGTMTLWSPNQTTPHVKLLAHRGPLAGIAIDPSESSMGRYCATAGLDGTVKLWDGRMWGKELRSWTVRNQPATISYSGRGILAVGGRTGVTTYRDVHKSSVGAPSPYLTLPLPGLSAYSTKFCPFDDIIAVGHNRGISSLLVPGSGEANFDSAEADVYETYSRRRERDVRSVMDKIRPELITMDTDYLGHISLDKGGATHAEREGRSFRQLGRMERLRATGKADEDEDEWNGINSGDEGADANEGERPAKKEKVKHKQRGKGTGMKRYLAKKKKNVVDKELVSGATIANGAGLGSDADAVAARGPGQGGRPEAGRGHGAQGGKWRGGQGDWCTCTIRMSGGVGERGIDQYCCSHCIHWVLDVAHQALLVGEVDVVRWRCGQWR